MRTIDFERTGDYLSCYGSDALIVARELGLVRLTVDKRHETPRHSAGQSHTIIPVHAQAESFAALRKLDWFPRVIEVAK
jgi:DNA mismatch repair ATPase MutS